MRSQSFTLSALGKNRGAICATHSSVTSTFQPKFLASSQTGLASKPAPNNISFIAGCINSMKTSISSSSKLIVIAFDFFDKNNSPKFSFISSDNLKFVMF